MNYQRIFENFLQFLKRYPLIFTFLVSILVTNIWSLAQNAQKIEDTAVSAPVTTTLDSSNQQLAVVTTEQVTTAPPATLYETVDNSYFDDALFIGDSRTEGLALYGSLTNADFFTSVGLSIFQVTEKSAGNPNRTESCTLAQKLAQQQYGKVYIMLGLNELGTGTTESWAQTYGDVLRQIRAAQPNAVIYVQSILVVSASQDDPSGSINNATVNTRNAALEALTDTMDNVYYLNVNEAVADANGCLMESLTSDGIHLLGNSLSLWEAYLKEHAIPEVGTGTLVGATNSTATASVP